MDKYTIYIICKSEEIFESKKKELSKFNKLISFFYWIPAVFLQIHETNPDLLSKLNTRYNTKEQKRIGHLGCISAHRNALLSIINNNTINNIILEEDATIENDLPEPPNDTCYLGGWIVPPQVSKIGKVKINLLDKKEGLNEIIYDEFKVLTTHSLFIKNTEDSLNILKSLLVDKTKNIDIHYSDNQLIKYYYYPCVFNQARSISDIDKKYNKSDILTINYGL
tara:strand:+ start:2143 stop:2811 length:669 start_codon:yes stop_codon:yes gene_type:complete